MDLTALGGRGMETQQNTQRVQPSQKGVKNEIPGRWNEHDELKDTISQTLKRFYPQNGIFSLQQRLVIRRFEIDVETLNGTFEGTEADQQKLWLTARTISKACPLTSMESVSFHYFLVEQPNGRKAMLAHVLHNKANVLRRLHQYGALEILRQNIRLGNQEYFLLDLGDDVGGICRQENQTLFMGPGSDEPSQSELEAYGLKLITLQPAWTGFSFCLAEQSVSRKKCLVVHGVAKLLHTLNGLHLIKIVDEQAYYDCGSPYSLTAVLELSSD